MPELLRTNFGDLTYEEALEVFQVGTVVRRFGTWVVTDWGLAALVTDYQIVAPGHIVAMDWREHMSRKTWCNVADFNAAYAFALEYHRADVE